MRFRRVVERLPAIVYLEAVDGPEDEPGPLLYVSPQVFAILGFSAEEWLDRPTAWAAPAPPRRPRSGAGHLSAGRWRRGEVRRRVPDVHARRTDPLVPRRGLADPRRARRAAVLAGDHVRRHRATRAAKSSRARPRSATARWSNSCPRSCTPRTSRATGCRSSTSTRASSELLGVEPEEWVADPSVLVRTRSIRTTSTRSMARTPEPRSTGEPFSIEYRMIARDGRIVWFQDEAVPGARRGWRHRRTGRA